MIKVLFGRLLELLGENLEEIGAWPGSPAISLDEVVRAKKQGVVGDSRPYGDTWRHPVREVRDMDYHIARIVYFLDHPEEVAGMDVDNGCTDNGILPTCEIVDGWHRLAAAIILNPHTVDIEYGGRVDVMDYLTGASDVRPDEPIFLDIPMY